MVSSASLSRIQHDIDIVKGKHPLTDNEKVVLKEILEKYFTGPEATAVQSWEGDEPAAYWIKLGKTLRTQWYVENGTFPEKIAAPSGSHSHKA